MKTFLATAAIAFVLSVASAQAQYQGSDEARDYVQSWTAATSGYSNGYYRYAAGGYDGAYARYYYRRALH